ncbi:hypothetical protein P7C71_g4189, partial [Lecanoromycetidae sp. Uapishka_2]
MAEMKVGQLAGPNERFCPFAAVNKWPYRHLHGEDSDNVSQKFFASGQFRARGWTIYYIRTLLDPVTKPLLLIPKSEVEALFLDIYDTFGIFKDFPDSSRHPGWDLGFQEEGSPRPHYLGRLTNDCSLLELEEIMPTQGIAPEEAEGLQDRTFPAFRRKMEAAILAGKNAKKNANEKKKRDRINMKRRFCEQLRRTQCYLGIRPRGTAKQDGFHADPNHTHEESLVAQAEYERAAGLKLPDLTLTSPVPYPFDTNVVFVCVDIEAWERDHKIITEIGISTLDTNDLVGIPPGEGGMEWMKKLRGRHFRIAEYAHHNNTDFVAGCAANFEDKFGTSEWISIKEAPQVVASCFRHPFSAPGQYTPFPHDVRMITRNGSGSQYLPPINEHVPKRNIVLVGHEIKSDLEYLRTIGYDVTNLSNLLEAVDTIDLYKAMKRGSNTPSLGAVLLDLGLVGWNLHNAGNDAGYTMEALIGISFTSLTITHAPAPNREHLDAAAAEAQARIIEDTEEWEIADEEGGDGGEAVKLSSIEKMRADKEFEQGMRRAEKAEEKARRVRSVGGGPGRGGYAGRGGGSGYGGQNQSNFSPMQAASGGQGVTQFHAANEKRQREKVAGGSQWGGKQDAKGAKKEDVPLSEQMKNRLKILDDEDDYFTI